MRLKAPVVNRKTALHAQSVASAVAVAAAVDVAKAESVQSAAVTNPAKVVKPPQPWQPMQQARLPSVVNAVNVVSAANAVAAMSVALNVPVARKKATAKRQDARISKPLNLCLRRKHPADLSKARNRPPAPKAPSRAKSVHVTATVANAPPVVNAASVHRSARSQAPKVASASKQASRAITATATRRVKAKPLPSHASPTSAPPMIAHL